MSAAHETIKFTIEDDVAKLTLNRPDRLNSFNIVMHEEVKAAVAQAETEARCLLITGAGRGFCAGQDLADRAVCADGSTPDLGHSLEMYYNPLVRRITSMEIPVICAVNGVAAGAGVNVALACDMVLAAKSAKFVQSFSNLGLLPDSGGSWILPRLIGQARAMGLTLTGTPITADQALDWGMIWQVHEDAALMEAATALAQKLANGPTRGLAATKTFIRTSGLNSLDTQLDLERDKMRELGQSEDYKEGVAAFLAKRPPAFTGK